MTSPHEPAPSSGHHLPFDRALQRLPSPMGMPFAELFSHGSLSVEIFSPKQVDTQQPHARDEVYVVVTGRGEFLCAETRFDFGPGDFLFVPAGVVHRFERFTDDLVVWVFFYGPDGGEGPVR